LFHLKFKNLSKVFSCCKSKPRKRNVSKKELKDKRKKNQENLVQERLLFFIHVVLVGTAKKNNTKK
jgi:hypothetical protein